MIFTLFYYLVSRLPRRPLKIFPVTFKISVNILKSFLPGIIYLFFCCALIIFIPSVSVFQRPRSPLANLAPVWGPLTAFHLCCRISGEAESRWMPCPSPLHISKHLTKKVSIIYFLSVDKESEIERGQMTSLTHRGNQWHSQRQIS